MELIAEVEKSVGPLVGLFDALTAGVFLLAFVSVYRYSPAFIVLSSCAARRESMS